MQNFLKDTLGKDKGKKIYSLQQIRLEELLNKTTGKTKKQMKTLRVTIMPRIALYQILQESGLEQQEAYDIVKSYMVDVVCKRMSRQFRKLDKLPFLYSIVKRYVMGNLLKGENWKAKLIHADGKSFTMHINKCLWYDATVENGCPELCRVFCECDDINFAVFSRVEFYREGTLGMGADKCNFTFRKAGKRRSAN